MPHLTTDLAALWPKIDHLLYQPILGLERPRCFYYYQGAGLAALYGFTYKYLTLEHFLGQLGRIQVGSRLAGRLARLYVQAWYPGDEALTLLLIGTPNLPGPSSALTPVRSRCGAGRCPAPSN